MHLSGNHFKALNRPPKALLNPTFLGSLQIRYCVPYLWSLWSVHIVGWTCGEAQTGGFDCTNPFKAGTGGTEAGFEKGWRSPPFLDPHLSPLLVSSNTPALVADISKTTLLWLRRHWGWKWLLPRPRLCTAWGHRTEEEVPHRVSRCRQWPRVSLHARDSNQG